MIGQRESRPRSQIYNEQEMHVSIDSNGSKTRDIDLIIRSHLSIEKWSVTLYRILMSPLKVDTQALTDRSVKKQSSGFRKIHGQS